MKTPPLRSKLGTARGHGAAHHGVMHWWLQRVTAVALVPLSLWFLVSLFAVAQAEDPFYVADWLSSPVRALLLVALLVPLFWHAKLGLQVVIEDYVHAPFWKYALLLLNNFFCWGGAVACLMAVLRLHTFSLVAGV